MKKYMAIEDNGGGLTLVVFAADGETIEYLLSGYEYNPGQLSEDLGYLNGGADPAKEWDGNFLDDEEMTAHMENPHDCENWFPWEQRGQGWNIVADNDGIYPEAMGVAARMEFKREDKWRKVI